MLKNSLFKLHLLSRSFVTVKTTNKPPTNDVKPPKLKINKYKNISAQVPFPPIVTNMAVEYPEYSTKEEDVRYSAVRRKGDPYLPLDWVSSKALAMQLGKDAMWDRKPLSAWYSIKVKDITYHVFNSARIVSIHIL